MSRYLLILVLTGSIFPVYALEFHVCTDKQGIRHISSHAEFFNPDCSIRKDIYLKMYQMQYNDIYNSYLTTNHNVESERNKSEETNGTKSRIKDMLDPDKALEELSKTQQQRRDDIPFKTHLQTEGFKRLLELQ